MWRTIFFLTILAVFLIDFVFLRFKLSESVYNRFPGPCTQFSMNGSEDIIILPNNQAIITGGFCIGDIPDFYGALYVLRLEDPHKGPEKLQFQGTYLNDHPDFSPHGISYWIDKNGDIYLYIVCHWNNQKDSIDVFLYNPDEQSVQFVRSIPDQSGRSLNNLIMIDKDEFYVTNWKYFSNQYLHIMERVLALPLSELYHVKNGQFKTVASGFKSANGIHASRNRKFIYVANSLKGEIIAYSRSSDGSLSLADTIQLGYPLDNINVDEKTGNIWLPMIIKPLDLMKHVDDTSVPVSIHVIQLTVDEDAENPFKNSKIESVLMSDGVNGLGAVSVAAYTNHTLLLGSILTNMMVCDVRYLLYN